MLLVRVVRGSKKIQRHRGELNWGERITIKRLFKRFAKKKKKGDYIVIALFFLF